MKCLDLSTSPPLLSLPPDPSSLLLSPPTHDEICDTSDSDSLSPKKQKRIGSGRKHNRRGNAPHQSSSEEDDSDFEDKPHTTTPKQDNTALIDSSIHRDSHYRGAILADDMGSPYCL
jgi:hypothetical protein